jgi:DNA-binding response OmpR family regulator
MKKKILVTDDDPGLQDVFRLILEQAGYEVAVLDSGEAILEDRYETPDLFLLDKSLAGTDGTFICKHLKAGQRTKDIPVIMISAVFDIEKMANECGADGFIEKPFKKKHLLNMVGELIRHERGKRA